MIQGRDSRGPSSSLSRATRPHSWPTRRRSAALARALSPARPSRRSKRTPSISSHTQRTASSSSSSSATRLRLRRRLQRRHLPRHLQQQRLLLLQLPQASRALLPLRRPRRACLRAQRRLPAAQALRTPPARRRRRVSDLDRWGRFMKPWVGSGGAQLGTNELRIGHHPTQGTSLQTSGSRANPMRPVCCDVFVLCDQVASTVRY